ncbi:hypothetical protein [Streptosporangium sp. 'caverna']|uniref:hypothetical protein n=1 Tax=Streptosporangium sp. 'caverna' TaxID=2202249 RepID=UPI0013A7028A|nr:hypothetical protein [Streptosporangium sp. 'caverna']
MVRVLLLWAVSPVVRVCVVLFVVRVLLLWAVPSATRVFVVCVAPSVVRVLML